MWEKGRKMWAVVLKKSSLVVDEVRLNMYWDWLEIQSLGKRLVMGFIDWLIVQWSAMTNFFSPCKQDILVLTELMEYWQFGPVWKIKICRAVSLKCLLWLYFNMDSLMSSFTEQNGIHCEVSVNFSLLLGDNLNTDLT